MVWIFVFAYFVNSYMYPMIEMFLYIILILILMLPDRVIVIQPKNLTLWNHFPIFDLNKLILYLLKDCFLLLSHLNTIIMCL